MQVVEKVWGVEKIIIAYPFYAAKFLCFNAGFQSSFHAHTKKIETFYLMSGRAVMELQRPGPKDIEERLLTSGETVHLPRSTFHRVSALEDTVILEVSTEDDAMDVRRMEGQESRKMPKKELDALKTKYDHKPIG